MGKPLSMLINSMKGDQMDSMMKALSLGQEQAHTAAMEASQATAAQILASQRESAIVGAKNPMQAAMAQSMMPMFTNMMTRLMGTLMPGVAPQGSGLPQDWTRRTEAPKEEK